MTSSSRAIEPGRNYLIAANRNRTVWDESRAEVGTAVVVVLLGESVVGFGVYLAASVLIGFISLFLIGQRSACASRVCL